MWWVSSITLHNNIFFLGVFQLGIGISHFVCNFMVFFAPHRVSLWMLLLLNWKWMVLMKNETSNLTDRHANTTFNLLLFPLNFSHKIPAKNPFTLFCLRSWTNWCSWTELKFYKTFQFYKAEILTKTREKKLLYLLEFFSKSVFQGLQVFRTQLSTITLGIKHHWKHTSLSLKYLKSFNG